MATISTDIAQKIDIIIRENNTSTINLVIADSSGSAFDLSQYSTITFTVYDDTGVHITKTQSDGISSTLTGGSPSSDGKITIKLSVADTGILPKTYKHKLVFVKNVVLNNVSTNTETKTWMYGKFKINND